MRFPQLDPRSCGRVSRLTTLFAAVSVTSGAAVAQQPVQAPPVDTTRAAALAFQGATVIDIETGRRLPNQTIVVVGNRIQGVGPVDSIPTPAGARVIRADGTFVIPGLWDMHVHMFGFPNTFFPLLLANGVTGIRDMGTPFLDSMLVWRREIREGRRAGPRLLTAGPLITSHMTLAGVARSPIGNNAVGADTPEEGRHIVDSLKYAGVDFIKVWSGLQRDVYFAILAEARRVGLVVAGHLPEGISPVEASDSGQHSIEHGMGLRVCTDSSYALGVGFMSDPLGADRKDMKRCRELASRLQRNDTWVLPGPYASVPCFPCQLPWFREQERYWPDSLYDILKPVPGRPLHEPEARNVGLAQWAGLHRGDPPLHAAKQAGLRFILGSDQGPLGMLAFLRPGFSLQDLLWDLVQGGLTPLEALQTATLNPAKYLYATDSLGTVARGKLADLVFLDADPLVDIFNTRRIRAVVADGRFYDRADLDSLLIGVERLAKQSRRP